LTSLGGSAHTTPVLALPQPVYQGNRQRTHYVEAFTSEMETGMDSPYSSSAVIGPCVKCAGPVRHDQPRINLTAGRVRHAACRRETFTVRRVRADGTVTFNGARMSEGAAVRERDAWRDHGGTLVATVLPEGNDVTRREVRAWRVAVKSGQPFYGLAAGVR